MRSIMPPVQREERFLALIELSYKPLGRDRR